MYVCIFVHVFWCKLYMTYIVYTYCIILLFYPDPVNPITNKSTERIVFFILKLTSYQLRLLILNNLEAWPQKKATAIRSKDSLHSHVCHRVNTSKSNTKEIRSMCMNHLPWVCLCPTPPVKQTFVSDVLGCAFFFPWGVCRTFGCLPKRIYLLNGFFCFWSKVVYYCKAAWNQHQQGINPGYPKLTVRTWK